MSEGLNLLSAVVRTGSTQTLARLNDSLFVDSEIEIYRWIKAHHERYGEVPTSRQTDSHWGRGTLPTTDGAVDYYFTQLRERAYYNTMRPQFTQLRDMLVARDMPAVSELVQELYLSSRDMQETQEVVSLGQAARQVLETYEHAHWNPGLQGVPTGFPYLDEETSGYQNGDLIFWVARPGMGKTYFLLWQALTARSAGRSLLFVSMEMPALAIARRIVSLLSGIEVKYIISGQLPTRQMRIIEDAIHDLEENRSFNIVEGNFKKNMGEIDSLIHEHSPDAIYIDGIYLMNPNNTAKLSGKRSDKTEVVVGDIKRATIIHNRPIICTNQFNRAAGNKGEKGDLTSISYSDAVGTDSSLVIGISPGNKGHKETRRTLSLMKGREGAKGDWCVNYTFKPVDFSEVSKEQIEAEAQAETANQPSTEMMEMADWVPTRSRSRRTPR